MIIIDGYQNIYTVETGYKLVINGCSKSSGTVYLYWGSLFKQIKIKSLAESLTLVAFENFISS